MTEEELETIDELAYDVDNIRMDISTNNFSGNLEE